jgi:hypothetical protein
MTETPTLTLIATAEAPRTAPAPESGDFTPEPIPDLSDWIDAGLAQAKGAQHDVFTVVDTLAQMFAHSARASSACQLRILEMAQANAAASYELARELFAASSWSRLIELSSDGARRQAATAAAQLRELSDLTRRVATETTEPLSANIARVFQQAA